MRQQLQEGPDDLKALARETNKIAKDALAIAKKTRASLRWMAWMGMAKFLLIFVPLVAAIIFLTPYISALNKQISGATGGKGFFESLKSLPEIFSGGNLGLPKNIDPKLIEEFLKKQ